MNSLLLKYMYMKRSLHSGCILHLLNNAHLFNTVIRPHLRIGLLQLMSVQLWKFELISTWTSRNTTYCPLSSLCTVQVPLYCMPEIEGRCWFTAEHFNFTIVKLNSDTIWPIELVITQIHIPSWVRYFGF